MMKRYCVLAGIFMLLLSITSFSATRLINFQGRLTTIAGTPETGEKDIMFRLFEVGDGGSEVWHEQVTCSLDSIGAFSAILGSGGTPSNLAIDFSQPLWMQVEYNSNIFLPRQQLASVPYAFYALTAESVVGGTGGGGGISTAEADTRYIMNTTEAQAASFRITGTGSIDGGLTVGAASIEASTGKYYGDGSQLRNLPGGGGTPSLDAVLAAGNTSARNISVGKLSANGGNASGTGVVALGNGTIASGDKSIAMGSVTTASPYNSMVVGSYNIERGGDPSNWVPTDELFVVGNGYRDLYTYYSNALTVLKNGKTSIGTLDANSTLTVLGTIETQGTGGIKFPDGTIQRTRSITGEYDTLSSVVSRGATTTRGITVANLTVTGTLSANGGRASGPSSVALGSSTQASGGYSTAMGISSLAQSDYSTAMGQGSVAAARAATAIGYETHANGYYSTSMGIRTTAQSNGSLVIGQCNVVTGEGATYKYTDPVFVIGNGTGASDPSNAFTVFKDGLTSIGTSERGATLEVRGLIRLTGGSPATGEVLTAVDSTGLATWQVAGGGGGGGGISTAEADTRYIMNTSEASQAASFRITGTGSIEGDLTVGGNLKVVGTIEGGSPVKVKGGLTMMDGVLRVGLASIEASTGKIYSTGNGVFGGNLTATGILSANGGTASGNQSVALGALTVANQQSGTAMGYNSQATGPFVATAMGMQTIASGSYSTSMGNITIASGQGSTSMGFRTSAGGHYSSAFGDRTTTSGYGSTSMGFFTSAQSNVSLVIGRSNVINGTPNEWVTTEAVFVIGNGDDVGSIRSNALTVLKNGWMGVNTSEVTATLEVIGQVKIVDGTQGTGKVLTSDNTGLATWQTASGGGGGGISTAEADTRYIMNTSEVAQAASFNITGSGSIEGALTVGGNLIINDIMGQSITTFAGEGAFGPPVVNAESLGSVAMGSGTTASGNYNTAMGGETIASGGYATAMGTGTTAGGYGSTAMGNGSRAGGASSTAMGAAFASGNSSTAMGFESAADGTSSTAMGQHAIASGDASTAMGSTTEARPYASLAIGQYNIVSGDPTSWIDTDPVFIIGNGTDGDNRSNALTILKNAKTTIGTIEANREMLSVYGTIESYGPGNVGGIKFPDGTIQISAASGGGGGGGISTAEADTRYIMNTSEAAQAASFNITGTGSIESDLIVGGNLKVVGTIEGGSPVKVKGGLTMADGVLQVGTASIDAATGNAQFVKLTATATVTAGDIIGQTIRTSSGDAAPLTPTGKQAVAMGIGTKAQSYASMVIGRYNADIGTSGSWIATDPVFIIGNGTQDASRGNVFTVLKNGNTTINGNLAVTGKLSANGGNNSGTGAVALGGASTASGNYSSVMGISSTASSYGSTAMGEQATAAGADSVAMGQQVYAKEEGCIALGSGAQANGYNSVALGRSTSANGWYSTAMGRDTYANGYHSTAMGWYTTASGQNSTAMGNYTSAESFASLVIGRFNVRGGSTTVWNDTEPLFVIGNGVSVDARANALTVLKNAKTTIGTIESNRQMLSVFGTIESYGAPGGIMFPDGTTQITAATGGGGGGGISTAEADTRYIMNTSEVAQTANFNITGDGKIGGTLTIEGNLKVTGTIEGGSPVKIKGGLIVSSGDLTATGSITASALTIAGGINGVGGSTSAGGGIAIGSGSTASQGGATALGVGATAGGSGSTAIGNYPSATQYASTAIGNSTQATGDNSTAIGSGAIASGQYSVALGRFTNASAYGSTAMGAYTKASQWYSTAMGFDTSAGNFYSTAMGGTTEARGAYSTAMGGKTTAVGAYSTAMGGTTEARGAYSTAMGGKTTAVGEYATAMGKSSIANGTASTAMGYASQAGDYSIAAGNDAQAADYSTSLGFKTRATGSISTAMGESTTASAQNATAMGLNTTANATQSTAMGLTTYASGQRSTAMGQETQATGSRSTSMGYLSTASGNNSASIGYWTLADSFNSIAIGSGNVASGGSLSNWVLTEPLFVVGNSTNDASRSNALTVLKNAHTSIGTLDANSMLTVLGTIETQGTGGIKFPDATTQTTAYNGGTDANFKFTPEGGYAIKLINKTGGNSVKGTVVVASTTTDNAFGAAPGDSDYPIGVVYDSGVADGSSCWVVVSGIGEVLLKDLTAATHGQWMGVSDTTGRAKAIADPGSQAEHNKELGHCLESKSFGTDVLVKANLHFN